MSRSPELPRRARPLVALLACGLVAGVFLAGCSGRAVPTQDSSGGSVAVDAGGTRPEAVADPAQPQADGKDAVSTMPSGTRTVRTADQRVEVDDVRVAAQRVRVATEALGGVVGAEAMAFDRTPSAMTLRVPEPRLDDALNRFAGVGREVARSTTSDDVTAVIADLGSRVSTQERSVRRVRQLLDQAGDLSDVVLLESELARREAELEAAQARYRALEDQATLATVTLALVPKGSPEAQPQDGEGFLAGFDAGWRAVQASTTVLLTVLGAVLPFAIVIGALAVPVTLWRRRTPRQAGS